MKTNLLKISLRNQAIYIPKSCVLQEKAPFNEHTSALLANVKSLGFSFSESLLWKLNGTHPAYKIAVLDTLREVMGVHKNWTPLVKGWDVPTGESALDHVVTLFANVLGYKKGTTLACGHLIPENTFPLERYNGCPFCGTPFTFGTLEFRNQGSKLKILELWEEGDLQHYFEALLSSKTALDATQVDSLKILLTELPLPSELRIGMKETLMLVVDTLIEQDRAAEAGRFFKSPNDILRYLWYKHTGYLQVIQPKTIVKRTTANQRHRYQPLDTSAQATVHSRASLKLKYSRKQCRMVARWLNDLSLKAEAACEQMHPKREMWVRFIRALRLAEYSKKKGYENLAHLLDVFYNETYDVWEGRVSHHRLRLDADKTFRLLKKRPGLFSRSLFSNMLWFGAEETIRHFREVLDEVPARLVLSLNMYAPHYFTPGNDRSVRPLGGTRKLIPPNRLLSLYGPDRLQDMQDQVEAVSLEVIRRRFVGETPVGTKIYVDPMLNHMPLAIGERSETLQDMPSALMGTRFPVAGSTIRLFMQWGEGLPAQHLDMDLSCKIAYDGRVDYCSYSQLTTKGCKHSGDIRSIPNLVGTAEYIDVNVDKLDRAGAKYVTFTCNAYSAGALSPNLVVGWMDSKYPMRISSRTGVAYDPSCVQHQVRITQGVSKGLVFGVLDVKQREIIWLEMSFGGQVVQNLDVRNVEALLAKLNSRMSIGHLLSIKAEAQQLECVDDPEIADEVYDLQWAMNAAAVTQLFLD
ncbi:hypothetical protein [Flavilitoribacter nigricans]|uniref:Prokaryotic RING finger family 4 n=1 Tax=Flavilitoribacter nigricans (strain ATCC 23147 / DSM 23189 / NBRC 102662 / NCIMB 1420 / SS-2) TaxID=1122177 RepID=A0A2D0MYV9_FLAN2|nr:hypothetical protein [Flavilitoribacter nigricans]PHN00643.1 hypothetical protein CRP01_41180 [Flavilitoribacter nigricans DSM 23189 = NBRC 102662]